MEFLSKHDGYETDSRLVQYNELTIPPQLHRIVDAWNILRSTCIDLNPITHVEILAFNQLRNYRLNQFEVEAINDIDQAFIYAAQKQQKIME